MDREEAALWRQIGRRVARLRERAGLTAEEVADAADLSSKQYVSEIENGRRGMRLPTLAVLAEQGLGASLEEVVRGVRVEGVLAAEAPAWYEDRSMRSFAKLARRLSALPEAERKNILQILETALDLAEMAER